MQASSAPPTWRILPTNGGHFRWVFSGGSNDASSQVEPPEALASEAAKDASSRLPSMEDVIRGEQSSFFSVEGSFLDPYDAAPPKHLGVRGGDVGGSAMFTTGSGRSVSVRQSSIQKARSILEGENITDKESAMGSDCFSTFRTGSGKSVQVRPSSLAKAASLFEGTIGKEGRCSSAYVVEAFRIASTMVQLKNITTIGLLFYYQEGSFSFASCHLQSIMSFSLVELLLIVTLEIVVSPSIFNQDLGRLQISHSLSNAASILVLEDNSEHSPLKCFKQLRHQIDINMLSNCENISKEILIYKNDSIGRTVNEENIQGNPHACLKDICSTGKQVSKDSLSGQHMHEAQYTTSTFPPVKFHTAGGRSISFSSDALKYAKSLLNDLDSKANYGNAETDEKNYEKPSFHGKDFSFDIFDEHSCMNRNIPVTTSGSSLQDVHRSKKSNSCSQNSMHRNFLSLHAHEACFKMILECRVAGGPLVDISNHIGSTFANKNLLTGEKKRPGVGSYSSSFKKPRSFRFNAPLNNVNSIVAATGKFFD
ncbi:hypothetical protein AXF42_Ash020566 [Apostasia shenzhenica]|uniref:Uncharacterized protein n=1 Tax=Apostasia shenzhenica TaxID=1088818 RepID=A0A2I0B5W3_9ASPA|nr:hypothetical protein AXF42_Ash020566 [Apostasia shenzhenica]